MPAVTHFSHYIIPWDELDRALIDRFEAFFDFRSPSSINILIGLRVQTADQ